MIKNLKRKKRIIASLSTLVQVDATISWLVRTKLIWAGAFEINYIPCYQSHPVTMGT